MKRTRYKTIFLSDLHLGSRGCEAEKLGRFLKRIECEKLYLVGDIIDFWRLKSKPYWPREHNIVIRRLLKIAERGSKIILVPGNHDETLRQHEGIEFGAFSIRLLDVHECMNGKRLLITHGDQFDMVVKHSKFISLMGSVAYEWLLVINRYYNTFRHWRGKPHWSLSQYIKLKVKSACTYISRFEESLLHAAKDRGVDGVVCGHIHKPQVDHRGDYVYYNCGDWIESCSALVETLDGEMKLIDYHDLVQHHHTDQGHDDGDELLSDEAIEQLLTSNLLIRSPASERRHWQTSPKPAVTC